MNEAIELNAQDSGLDSQFYKITAGCTKYFDDASKSTSSVMSTLTAKLDAMKKAVNADTNMTKDNQEKLLKSLESVESGVK